MSKRSKTSQSFLCGSCRTAMCADCRQIAEEYHELLGKRTEALVAAQQQVEELEGELRRQKMRADMWEKITRQGLPALITAWMDKDVVPLLKGVGDLIDGVEKLIQYADRSSYFQIHVLAPMKDLKKIVDELRAVLAKVQQHTAQTRQARVVFKEVKP